MSKQIYLSQLSKLSTSEQGVALRDLAASARAPRNGQAKTIQARIAAFEERYNCSSNEMRQRFRAGHLKEDESISEWLMLMRL